MKGRMGSTTVLAVLGLLAIAAGTALAQDVTVNYVPGTDFSKFKTYKWVEIKVAEKPDQILDAQITQAVEKTLACKGFTKATGDTADLFIAYQLALTQERQWNTYNTGGYGWRYGGGSGTTTSTTIQIGTVALDMYNVAARELVWKGQAWKTVDAGASPEKRQKKLLQGLADPPKTPNATL